MKKRNDHERAWLTAGILCALLVLTLAVTGLSGITGMPGAQKEIRNTAKDFMDCACAGDYEALSGLLVGSPQPEPPEESGAEALLWQAFRAGIRYRLSEDIQTEENGVSLEVTLDCPELSALCAAAREQIPAALEALLLDTEELTDVFEEDGRYRTEFLEQVLTAAARAALEADRPTAEHRFRLLLSRQEGRWLVVPTRELTAFLSGYITA